MVNPLADSAPLLFIPATDSTMAEARRMVAAAGADAAARLSGAVVCAGSQSMGRGRIAGRKWDSPPGESLLFTVIFSMDDLRHRMDGRPFTLLPLLCGLAAAEAVQDITGADGPEICIKWPNDILADGKKLCGILCEASGAFVYAGIGINLNQTGFPESLRRPACSIRMLTGRTLPAEDGFPGGGLLGNLLRRLGAAISNPGWRTAVEARLYRAGEAVSMLPGLPEELSAGKGYAEEIISGRLSGLDPSGAVVIVTPAGPVSVLSGELRL